MPAEFLPLLVAAVAAVALLYSSVGHAGASGYIAVMSLFSMAPEEIRPLALTLNVLVASIGTWKFWRAGRFSWPLFWPFALLAVPMAYLGGYLNLPARVFQTVVGIVLLLSALQLFVRPPPDDTRGTPPLPLALGSGAGLGLLAGLTGTGGGIFLTPLLIFSHWAPAATAAGVSAPFILLNSVAGLAGNLSAAQSLPSYTWMLALAVMAGGYVGAHLGSRRLPHTAIKRLLSAVLVIAGAKLILT